MIYLCGTVNIADMNYTYTLCCTYLYLLGLELNVFHVFLDSCCCMWSVIPLHSCLYGPKHVDVLIAHGSIIQFADICIRRQIASAEHHVYLSFWI